MEDTTKIRHHWTLLQYLVNKHGWSVGAELGLDTGRTYRTLLNGCPGLKKLYGVDCFEYMPEAPGGEVYANTDHDANYAQCKAIAAEHPCRAEIINSTTHDASLQFDDNSLDFIFIDADHSYDGVKQDIADWWPKVKPGGWVIGHDYSPEHWPGVVRAAQEYFGEPEMLDIANLLPDDGFVAMPFNVWGKKKPCS